MVHSYLYSAVKTIWILSISYLRLKISAGFLLGSGRGILPLWWTLSGSNRPPYPCKGYALPAELKAHKMPLCLSVQGTAKTFERLSKPYKVINPYYLALRSNPDLVPSRPTLHFHIVYYTEGNLLSFYLAISRGIEPRSHERQSCIIAIIPRDHI